MPWSGYALMPAIPSKRFAHLLTIKAPRDSLFGLMPGASNNIFLLLKQASNPDLLKY
jgi:hypothetical protein